MAAKVWANGLVILAAAALSLTIVVQGWLGVPITGSIALFLLGTVLHLFSTTSIGILLATVVRSMPQLSLLVILVVLPFQMLSGSITPRESMPEAVQTFMLAAPTTHYEPRVSVQNGDRSGARRSACRSASEASDLYRAARGSMFGCGGSLWKSGS